MSAMNEWTQDVERRLANLEKIVVQMLRKDTSDEEPVLRLMPFDAVTPSVQDDDDDLDLPPDPVLPPDVCTHQHQVLVRGLVQCAKCGYPLQQTGIIGDPARHGLEAARTEWAKAAQEGGPSK